MLPLTVPSFNGSIAVDKISVTQVAEGGMRGMPIPDRLRKGLLTTSISAKVISDSPVSPTKQALKNRNREPQNALSNR